MRRVWVMVGLLACLTASGEAMAQAKPGSYEALSTANRRIVSAIYEAQLGSRRDSAGHPLLSKDAITAMHRTASWEDLHQRLAARGYVATRSLADAIRSFNRDTPSATNRLLIISTGSGDQVVVSRYNAPRSAPSHPAQANIVPAPITVRPEITTVELPIATAAEPADAVAVGTMGGAVAPDTPAVIAGAARTSLR
jgi:hypothetical protein